MGMDLTFFVAADDAAAAEVLESGVVSGSWAAAVEHGVAAGEEVVALLNAVDDVADGGAMGEPFDLPVAGFEEAVVVPVKTCVVDSLVGLDDEDRAACLEQWAEEAMVPADAISEGRDLLDRLSGLAREAREACRGLYCHWSA